MGILEDMTDKTPRPPVIRDDRKSKRKPYAFVVAQDRFMSGWGECPGTSYYALAAANAREVKVLLENFEARSEMGRPQIAGTYAELEGRLGEGDHLVIADRGVASRWYKPGGFKKEDE